MDKIPVTQVAQPSCDLSAEIPRLLLLGDGPAIAEEGVQVLVSQKEGGKKAARVRYNVH